MKYWKCSMVMSLDLCCLSFGLLSLIIYVLHNTNLHFRVQRLNISVNFSLCQVFHIRLPSPCLKTVFTGPTGTPRVSTVQTSLLARTKRSSETSCTFPWTSTPCTHRDNLQVNSHEVHVTRSIVYKCRSSLTTCILGALEKHASALGLSNWLKNSIRMLY